MYAAPWTTVGEDSIVAPVAPVHDGWHVAAPHPAAGNTYSNPSNAPTNTESPDTAGEDSRIDCLPARPCHRGAQTACPHPAAAKTSSLPSLDAGLVWEPTYTNPPDTVGDDRIWPM